MSSVRGTHRLGGRHNPRGFWDAQLARDVSHADLAREHGVSSGVVSSAAKRRGLARPSDKYTEWDTIGLGLDYDGAVALAAGVSTRAAGLARQRRGIPRYAPDRQCPCGVIFAAKHPSSWYCSTECRRSADYWRNDRDCVDDVIPALLALSRLERTVAALQSSHTAMCVCGATFLPGVDMRLTCSLSCARRISQRGSVAAKRSKAESAGIHSPTVDKK